MTVDIHPARFIWLDTFPASVKVVDETENLLPGLEYRIIVTDNRFYVLTDDVDGPEALVNEALTDFSGNNKTGFTVVTENSTYLVRREDNCGCGSRLRGYHPFLGVPHEARNPGIAN